MPPTGSSWSRAPALRARLGAAVVGLLAIGCVSTVAETTGSTTSTSTTACTAATGGTAIVALDAGATTLLPGTTTRPPAVPPVTRSVETEGLRRLKVAGVPELAARAYLNASLRAPDALPGCRMPPEVLAAVGFAESKNGTLVDYDVAGRSTQVLRGYAEVGDDTDGGRWDEDDKSDWAVGPMQFTPATWVDLARDGQGDGEMDPSNFYDAALSAAAYLCHLAGPFPDPTFIAAQWDQHDRQVTLAEQRHDQAKQEWERKKDRLQRLTEHVETYPDDLDAANELARTPDPGPEPEYVEPDQLAGPAQFLSAVQRYYGPEGEVRDDYVDRIVGYYRQLVRTTAGAPVTEDDRVGS